MKFDNIITYIDGSCNAHLGINTYYFPSQDALKLFMDVSDISGVNDFNTVNDIYIKVCGIQSTYLELFGNWDGFNQDSNRQIIEHLCSDWESNQYDLNTNIVTKLFIL